MQFFPPKAKPQVAACGLATNWTTRCALSLVVAVAYVLISHTWSISKTYEIEARQEFHEQQNRLAVQQKGVTGTSTIGYLLLAMVGAFCLATRPLGSPRWSHPLTLMCLVYFAWCASSTLWSQSAGVSFRKTTILALLFVAAFGMARKVVLNDLPWIVAITSIFLTLYGFTAELAQGTFRPWGTEYRFAGTVHPNSQAMHAAVLCLAAGCLNWRRRDYPWIRLGLLSLGVFVLLLTKSRTSMAALLIAAVVALVARARPQQRIIVVATLISLICVVGLGYGFITVSTVNSTTQMAAMGRQEGVGSLTGRIPLWRELLKAVQQRPIIGHGYGSFWNTDNIRRYSEKFSWNIPQAHNAYLDMVLSTGLIGLMLYLLWAWCSLFVAAGRYGCSRRPGEMFALSMIVFSLVHGVAESKFPSGGMGSFFLYLAMVTLATRPPPASTQRVQSFKSEGIGSSVE